MTVRTSLRLISIIKSLMIIIGLTAFVLLVNKSIIDFNMMYPEQPIMYLANQKINTLWDLFNVYAHPQMMHFTIPFFRPSGHFLIYQIITPFLGWHNFKAFIVINLIFLSLTGYILIKIYELLFPPLKMGAFIAFSIYLMHPALTLSRFISLHFEFAYIFFLITGLYFFILFCHRNNMLDKNTLRTRTSPLRSMSLFYLSIGCYILATTFKEPAIMLGPGLAIFLLISLYEKMPPSLFIKSIFANRELRNIFFLLAAVSVTLAIYLTLPWPSLSNPLRPTFTIGGIIFSIKNFILAIFNINLFYHAAENSVIKVELWRRTTFPTIPSTIFRALSVLSFITLLSLEKNTTLAAQAYKRSILFLLLTSLLFIVLPLGWGLGYPWHYSLTLLMLSLIMGFCFEFAASFWIKSTIQHSIICLSFALIIGMQAITINKAAIEKYNADEGGKLSFKILRNAILFPPLIKEHLTSDTLFLIEDSLIKNWYISGGGGPYPTLISIKNKYANNFIPPKHSNDTIKPDINYNGTLFRWAFLMPYLHEMTFPFEIDHLFKVDSETIYLWLLHYDDIVCVGYDKSGNWHDKTSLFKENLLREKEKRQLQIHKYQETPFTILHGNIISTFTLPVPDKNLCQFHCDQTPECMGFSYIHYENGDRNLSSCKLHNSANSDTEPCPACTSYIKT